MKSLPILVGFMALWAAPAFATGSAPLIQARELAPGAALGNLGTTLPFIPPDIAALASTIQARTAIQPIEVYPDYCPDNTGAVACPYANIQALITREFLTGQAAHWAAGTYRGTGSWDLSLHSSTAYGGNIKWYGDGITATRINFDSGTAGIYIHGNSGDNIMNVDMQSFGVFCNVNGASCFQQGRSDAADPFNTATFYIQASNSNAGSTAHGAVFNTLHSSSRVRAVTTGAGFNTVTSIGSGGCGMIINNITDTHFEGSFGNTGTAICSIGSVSGSDFGPLDLEGATTLFSATTGAFQDNRFTSVRMALATYGWNITAGAGSAANLISGITYGSVLTPIQASAGLVILDSIAPSSLCGNLYTSAAALSCFTINALPVDTTVSGSGDAILLWSTSASQMEVATPKAIVQAGLAANPAPTSPVACTAPSVSGNGGPFAFRVNVGTGCATSVGSITMPANILTTQNGWVCTINDVSNPGSFVPRKTGTTATNVSFANYSGTNVLTNWTSGEVLDFQCSPF